MGHIPVGLAPVGQYVLCIEEPKTEQRKRDPEVPQTEEYSIWSSSNVVPYAGHL